MGIAQHRDGRARGAGAVGTDNSHDLGVGRQLGGRRLAALGTAQRIFTDHLDAVAQDFALILGSHLNTALGVGAQRLVGARDDERVSDADRFVCANLHTAKLIGALVCRCSRGWSRDHALGGEQRHRHRNHENTCQGSLVNHLFFSSS
jgi:hypothetical protein